MKEKISAFVITKNEENKIARCLEHLKWVDELIVVDSNSTDNTVKIAKGFTKKVFKKEFIGYAEQKQAAIAHCTNNWILEIDADEVLTKAAQDEIKALASTPELMNKHSAYTIEREEFFLAKPLMTSTIVRLYRKDKVKYKGIIHEKLEIQGTTAALKEHIIHESDKYEGIKERIRKNNWYTTKEVEKRVEGKERISKTKTIFLMIAEPIVYSSWLYLGKGLWTKGVRGILWCMIAAYYHFLIYAKYYEYIYIEKKVSGEK